MHTGKAILILRNGRRISVAYQFGRTDDDSRGGYLLCDTSEIDPAALCERIQLLCDDGTELIVAVTHSGDRYLGVTGRVARAAA